MKRFIILGIMLITSVALATEQYSVPGFYNSDRLAEELQLRGFNTLEINHLDGTTNIITAETLTEEQKSILSDVLEILKEESVEPN